MSEYTNLKVVYFYVISTTYTQKKTHQVWICCHTHEVSSNTQGQLHTLDSLTSFAI